MQGSAIMKWIKPADQGENSSLIANAGLSIIKTSIDLNAKMDKFIKEHERWKAKDIKRKEELNKEFALPVLAPTANPSKDLKKAIANQQNNSDNYIQEFAAYKRRMQIAHQQKIDMDITLQTYKKQLDAINAGNRVVSSLNEIQFQLQLASQLSKTLKSTEELNKVSSLLEDKRINKVLADLDEDMKELNELLY
eukprot:TRINITY_DN738_c0_g6_i1.p1 TRINITY_DN738_c0_g6~~TRINITY_DN738_c0_g6_i1.p1  ORF type:complete len:194 (+),score=47.57 TRINITY_DN738_c0_g6_i1:82-663(+)